MTKQNMEDADLPEADNPSQNSQTANAIRNQSTVRPGEYPAEKRKAGKTASGSRKKQ